MEHMESSSLDQILNEVKKIHEEILAKVSIMVLQGLVYLKGKCQIVCQDVRSSHTMIK